MDISRRDSAVLTSSTFWQTMPRSTRSLPSSQSTSDQRNAIHSLIRRPGRQTEEPSCGTALSDSARIGGTHPPLGCAGGACAWLHPEPLLVPLDFVVWARLRATWRNVQGTILRL